MVNRVKKECKGMFQIIIILAWTALCATQRALRLIIVMQSSSAALAPWWSIMFSVCARNHCAHVVACHELQGGFCGCCPAFYSGSTQLGSLFFCGPHRAAEPCINPHAGAPAASRTM